MVEQPPSTCIVYIAAAYTHGSPWLRDTVEEYRKALREQTNMLVLEWLSTLPTNAADLYVQGMGNVHLCGVMVVFIDEPSIGVGIEIREAMISSKPILCLHRPQSRVSRLLASVADIQKWKISIESYRTINEAVQRTVAFVNTRVIDMPVAG